jgi:glucuronate isomerase
MDVGNGFLHPDRLFPADPATRTIARDLYETVRPADRQPARTY